MLSLSMIFESLITIKNLPRCTQNALSTMFWRGIEGTRKKVVVFGVFKAKALLPVKGQRGEWRERPLPQNQWVDFPKVFDFS